MDFSEIEVVAPNLHRRYSGVTSTVMALLPWQAKDIRIAAAGWHVPSTVPRVPMWKVILGGWSRPRVWHARRNDEMIVGVLLRYGLFQPWKLVFTSAAQRKHTRFTRFLIRRMDHVIATSWQAASYLEREATVIEHGVDLRRFQPASDKTSAWQETGLPGRHGIGAFGRVRAQKGSDLFVTAMIRLLPKYPEWTAVITGLEAPEEAAFIRKLKADITAAGLNERIRLMGEVPRDEVPLWFRRVSLYVAPMRWEGFGLTTLEAMASGTAVVATRTGASPQIVVEGETGNLIPPDDLDALTSAIEPYLANPQLALERGTAGRLAAERRHDIAAEAAAINAIYRKQLDRRRALDS